IANCNVLIEELEKSGKTVLLPHRFHIIKGEAYSLRAFLHLELNRMFAARYVDGTEKSIPYVEQFDMQISKHLSQEEVMAKIIKDFQIGIAELKEGDDPAISGNLGLDMDESETIDFFMSSRSERLNYYAAYALLARAYMWKGDRDNALVAIDTVLNTKNYPKYPTNEWTFSAPNNEDLLVSSEIIFRLRDEKILKSYEWFTKIEQNNYSGFLALKNIEEYFIDGGDYRKIHSIKTNNSEMYPYSIKYKKGDDYSVGRRIPVIRVAELLYYKAEILYDKQPQEAIRILDDFQKTRGIAVEVDKSVNKKDFIKLITQDARREFIGEGQFFLFNKRLGQNLYYGKKEIQMEDFWIFPKPDGELEFIQSK
ncbi:MAG: RagB/SusD family nutrient uptake outer membrane protein, partial [Odoribacter sp.]